MRPIDQQVILVTGATDGLGRGLARELAARGPTVLLHGRDAAKGDTAVREIRQETGSERLRFYLADFSSLAQVRALAERVFADHERLDVLVNNAGIGTVDGGSAERAVSEDGHELRFAVNYLAPFLLTRLLEPLLVRSAPGANRQRRLGADRLRRRDARAQLQRRPGLLPEQAGPCNAHLRPGR